MANHTSVDLSMFDNGPVCILRWSGEGDHPAIFATNNIEQILGYTAEEFVSGEFDYAGLLDPADLDRVFSRVKDHIAKKSQESFSDEYRIRRKDGEYVYVSDHTQLLWGANGEITELVGYITDVTSQVSLREKVKDAELEKKLAESANKSKSEFLANMSHEIRTPLNGIMGMSDLLSRQDVNDQSKEFIAIIQRSSQALLTIINDVLDFSKIEAGQVELEARPFALRPVIEDVAALLGTATRETGVDLIVKIDPSLPRSFLGDSSRLRQILTNLVGNAVKFTPKGHVLIDVSGEVIDDQASLNISVIDTGIGIPADKLDNIFDQFRQADNSTTRKYGGTGLGLSIARHLATLMGGDIRVTSTVDKGSTFTVTPQFPVIELPKTEHEIHDTIFRGNILIVDDNEINYEVLKGQLTSPDCTCIGVDSARKGIAFLQKAHEKNVSIDLVIVDYQMPEHTGGDFVRALRKIDAYKDVPVIMLSSVDPDQLKSDMLRNGVDAYLTKPARLSVLQRTISQVMSRPDAVATQPKQLAHRVGNSGPSKDNRLRAETERIDVLIAEDNEVNQIYIGHLMNELQLSFRIAENGQEAVTLWKDLKPGIVLMDLAMPIMNGFEATRNIRELEAAQDIARTPIIAVTANAMKEDEQKCLDQGMDAYIAKPVSSERLREKIDLWTDLLSGIVSQSASS